jgi:hypothetical protein
LVGPARLIGLVGLWESWGDCGGEDISKGYFFGGWSKGVEVGSIGKPGLGNAAVPVTIHRRYLYFLNKANKNPFFLF